MHNVAFPGLHHVTGCMLLPHRICKDEVIADFDREVRRIKEVKLCSSRQPGLLEEMETFLVVKFPPFVVDLKCTTTP